MYFIYFLYFCKCSHVVVLFFRRLLKNPAYYGLESLEPQDVNGYLSNLVDKTLLTLFHAGCVNLDEVGFENTYRSNSKPQ